MNERKTALLLTAFAISLLILLMAGPVGRSWAQDPGPGIQAGTQGLVPPVLQYQGRLLLTSGQPIADGFHSLLFRLYPASDSVTAVYTETDNMNLTGGLVSTEIGGGLGWDPQTFFNGQQYWLGVTVDLDPVELTPRQPMLPVPYALGLVPGAVISGPGSPATLVVRNPQLGSTALQVDGNMNVTGTLNVGAIVGAGHPHDFYTRSQSESRYVNTGGPETMVSKGAEPVLIITPYETGMGIIATAPLNIALSGETGATSQDMAGVFGVAGPTSTSLPAGAYAGVYGKSRYGYGVAGVSDANVAVYGQSSTGYGLQGAAGGSLAAVYGNNTGSGISVYGRKETGTSGAALQGYSYGSGSGIRAYSANEWSGYFYGGGLGAIYAGGNSTIAGTLTTQKVAYSTPRTHYFTVPSNVFQPRHSGVLYDNGFNSGSGGGCITSGSTGSAELWAQVNLPDGAEITEFRAYFRDNTTAFNGLTIFLVKLNVAAGGYSFLGSAAALAASTGLYSVADTSISGPIVDNTTGGYAFYANFATTDCSVMLMGARVTYTISEAE